MEFFKKLKKLILILIQIHFVLIMIIYLLFFIFIIIKFKFLKILKKNILFAQPELKKNKKKFY